MAAASLRQRAPGGQFQAAARSNKIENEFLSATQQFCCLMPAMQAGKEASPKAGAVLAAPVPATARFSARSRGRFEVEREKSIGIAIVSSLFLVLIAAALLVGGHVAIDPLLRSAMASREARAVGEVYYAMSDGMFCRHMSFDNATGEVNEGAIEKCADDIAVDRGRTIRGFSWSSR